MSMTASGMFHRRAYVTIVHPFNTEEILKSLVMQLLEGRLYNDKYMVDSSLWRRKTMTRAYLMDVLGTVGMRCLVVLDNVLHTQESDFIVDIFRGMRNSPKIIVTTREANIAMHCSGNTESMYMLKPLEQEDGFDLFTRKAFGENIVLDQQYPELVEQANLLLSKCDGLPLAIVAIGALLEEIPKTELEWSKLNEHISAALEMKPQYGIVGILLLRSYYTLSYHLKSSVLYLPIFPENHKVRRRRLIRRLAAEGYPREVRNMSAEETADVCFMQLISRNIILPCQLSTDTREGIHSYQVRDLMYEIVISRSRDENFVLKLEESCSQNTQSIVRHLAISSNWKGDQSELESIVDTSRLRSITVFGKWRPFVSLDKMRLLRVLDLEDTSGLADHHLKHIGRLLHLKYLSLRGCGDIYHLPDSLGNLRLLEMLDVKGTKIIKLPKTISKLRKLQHVVAGHAGSGDDDIYESMSGSEPKLMRKLALITVFSAGFCVACCAPHRMKEKMDIDGDVNRRDVCTMCCCAMLPELVTHGSTNGVAVPRGISKLKALITLGTVNVSGWRKTSLKDIKGFTQLRKLGVAGINRRNGRELCSAITHLGYLQSLSVRSDGKHGLVGCLDGAPPPENLKKLKLYGRLGRLPYWIQWLGNLVKLKLLGSCLSDCDAAMQTLGKLPNLDILILLENSFEGEELHFSFQTEAFPSLLVLQLQSLDVVRRVEFEEGATPKLEVLRFGLSSDGDCRFYGLQHPLRLREVVLSNKGPYSTYMEEDMREQLAANPNRPALRLNRPVLGLDI